MRTFVAIEVNDQDVLNSIGQVQSEFYEWSLKRLDHLLQLQ